MKSFIYRTTSSGLVLKGYINSWKVYGVCSSYLQGVAIKVRYQIGGSNRYCGNIGRQHKSNQIIVECDLHPQRHHMIQSCWDPECKGYRSPPFNIPIDIYNKEYENILLYQEKFIDRCAIMMLEEQGL